MLLIIHKLGIADDYIQGIEDKIKDFLISCVETNFTNITDLLTSGMYSGTGIGQLVRTYLGSPFGSASNGTWETIKTNGTWETIKTISDDSIKPIAITIVTIISVYDLVQMIITGNNMRDFDTAIFIKWAVKTNIAIILCSNVYSIVGWLFQIGTSVATSARTTLGITLDETTDITSTIHEALKLYSYGELFVISLLAGLVSIVVFFMFGTIIVVLCSRIIEALMYMAISPIPMATMMNSEWRQIGNSWLRGIIAIAFQGFFIVIAIAFFGSLFTDVFSSITETSKASTVIFSLLKLLGFACALIFTILRTERISKTMFSAT